MMEAVKATTEGRGSALFLFTTIEALRANDIFTMKWRSGKGEWVTLAD